MDNPAKDGRSTDNYREFKKGKKDNGYVHLNSGIMNLAFYLLSEGGKHPRGITQNEVTGIGFESALRIYYHANVHLFTRETHFPAARMALAASAESIFGKCSNEWHAVHQSYDAVQVPGNWNSCDPDATSSSGNKLNLLNYLDAYDKREMIYQKVVVDQSMPPAGIEITEAEKQLVASWINGGAKLAAPAGSPEEESEEGIIYYEDHIKPQIFKRLCAECHHMPTTVENEPTPPPNNNINYALSSQIAASSAYSPEFNPRLMIDQNKQTLWASRSIYSPNQQEWVTLDFGTFRQISKLAIHFDQNDRPLHMTILSWNGRWQEAARVPNVITGTNEISIPHVNTRYLMIAFHIGRPGRWIAVREIEVY